MEHPWILWGWQYFDSVKVFLRVLSALSWSLIHSMDALVASVGGLVVRQEKGDHPKIHNLYDLHLGFIRK